MENNLENKARFFALYYGQRIFKVDGLMNLQKVDGFTLHKYKQAESYLSLRSIESLTDEEAISVAKIAYNISFTVADGWTVERDNEYEYITVKSEKSHHAFDIDYNTGEVILYHDDNKSDMPLEHGHVFDYLRSIGVLIPFMGLSCETIIEYGWAKLREGKE